MLRSSCGAIVRLASRVCETAQSPPSLRVTILASTIFLAIVITTSVVTGEIDLTKLMPGATAEGRPRIVVVDGRFINQGDAPALNLEMTRPRYRLLGTLSVGEGIPVPANDFAVQYEWRDGENLKRETRSFKTGGEPPSTTQTSARRPSTTAITTLDSATLPPGLVASYDPITRALAVSANRPIEVRVDGFLLRPISRTDKDGAEYRFAQANILVLGQDFQRGETTVFEVVFTKPQDYYSIPIYVREPGQPPAYLTVSVATRAGA